MKIEKQKSNFLYLQMTWLIFGSCKGPIKQFLKLIPKASKVVVYDTTSKSNNPMHHKWKKLKIEQFY